jgi:hypothetical protein
MRQSPCLKVTATEPPCDHAMRKPYESSVQCLTPSPLSHQSNPVSWCSSLRSLFGGIGPEDVNSILKTAPSTGWELTTSPPGPQSSNSKNTIRHFSFLRYLRTGGCLRGCVRVYVPFQEVGEIHILSLSSDRINQINLCKELLNESQMALPFYRLQKAPVTVLLIYQRKKDALTCPLPSCNNNQNHSIFQGSEAHFQKNVYQ